jgi:hypothetical protein
LIARSNFSASTGGLLIGVSDPSRRDEGDRRVGLAERQQHFGKWLL